MKIFAKICPACKSSDLTPNWILEPSSSHIAKTLGITTKGKYALKVT